jgi:hypothetical protein
MKERPNSCAEIESKQAAEKGSSASLRFDRLAPTYQ